MQKTFLFAKTFSNFFIKSDGNIRMEF